MQELQLGSHQVYHLCAARFRLDGGAMFGVVPRPLWEQQAPPDDRNRIEMACNCLLVRSGEELTLIDTGVGTHHSPKERELFDIDPETSLPEALRQWDFEPEDVTRVVLTHLHFDHAGGALEPGHGGLRPAFPAATYVIQRGEWEDAFERRSIMRSSYHLEALSILEASNQVRFIQGDVDLAPGLTTWVTGGHTTHHQGVHVRGGGRTLVYPSELIPTRAHISPYWNMAYDMDPYQALVRKRELLEQACAEDWIVAWNHDPQKAWSRLRREGDRYVAADVGPAEAG